MSPLFTSDTEATSDPLAAGSAVEGNKSLERPGRRRVDSNAVRWVVAATVAFWLVVYAAGSHYF